MHPNTPYRGKNSLHKIIIDTDYYYFKLFFYTLRKNRVKEIEPCREKEGILKLVFFFFPIPKKIFFCRCVEKKKLKPCNAAYRMRWRGRRRHDKREVKMCTLFIKDNFFFFALVNKHTENDTDVILHMYIRGLIVID